MSISEITLKILFLTPNLYFSLYSNNYDEKYRVDKKIIDKYLDDRIFNIFISSWLIHDLVIDFLEKLS